jgi:hypothetical protein
VLDGTYNLESQTLTAKEAFVSNTESVYLLAASLAYDYCVCKGSTDAISISTQATDVTAKFTQYWSDLNQGEKRAKENKDKIICNGWVVSKKLNAVDCNETKSLATKGLIDNDTLQKMKARADLRNTTIIAELQNAGFTNIQAAYYNGSTPAYYFGFGIDSGGGNGNVVAFNYKVEFVYYYREYSYGIVELQGNACTFKGRMSVCKDEYIGHWVYSGGPANNRIEVLRVEHKKTINVGYILAFNMA